MRQAHGISNGDGEVMVMLSEGRSLIRIDMRGLTQRTVSPESARYLATKLRALAKKIEEADDARS